MSLIQRLFDLNRGSSRTVNLSSLTPILKLWLGLGLGLIFFLTGVGLDPVWGHGAIANVTYTLTVTAAYETGDPMAGAQVLVYSPRDGGTPWKVGETGPQGDYRFTPDTDGSWDVVIRQAGHGKTVTIPVGAATSGGGTLPRVAGILVGLWGLVGTALFFSRGKKS